MSGGHLSSPGLTICASASNWADMFSLRMHSTPARASVCLWFWPGDASAETCAHSGGVLLCISLEEARCV